MITIKGDLILTEDTIFNEDLKVEGDIKGYFNLNVIGDINAGNIKARNIDAWNIDARNIDTWNIDAGNINARNINAGNIIFCDKIKVKEGCKVICKVLITDRFSIEKKEQVIKQRSEIE